MITLFQNLRDAGRNMGARIGGGDFTPADCAHAAQVVADLLAALERLESVREAGDEIGALEQARAAIAAAKGDNPATHIRLQYLPASTSRTWRNSSLTMWAAGRENMEASARALKVQERWHDWRIVPHSP